MPTTNPSNKKVQTKLPFKQQKKKQAAAAVEVAPDALLLRIAFDIAKVAMTSRLFTDVRFEHKEIGSSAIGVYETLSASGLAPTNPSLWVALKRGTRCAAAYDRLEVHLSLPDRFTLGGERRLGVFARLRLYPFHAADWRVYGVVVVNGERTTIEAAEYDIHRPVLDILRDLTRGGAVLPWPAMGL